MSDAKQPEVKECTAMMIVVECAQSESRAVFGPEAAV
jgi:hypothetical protein